MLQKQLGEEAAGLQAEYLAFEQQTGLQQVRASLRAHTSPTRERQPSPPLRTHGILQTQGHHAFSNGQCTMMSRNACMQNRDEGHKMPIGFAQLMVAMP